VIEKKNIDMKHIKRFNESMEEDEFQHEETRMEEEPRFTLKQLEGAFISARKVMDEKSQVPFSKMVSDAGLEARFANFKEWFFSELGSSNTDITPNNYQFRDQDKTFNYSDFR
jgi:hypothetical protein